MGEGDDNAGRRTDAFDHGAVASPPPATPPPSAGDRYLLLEQLGEGGMGVVHAAYDRELDRKVAVKLLQPERAPSPAATARLLREAQALARLQHPNVVGVYDVGTIGGQVFVAMELVDGVSLRAWLAERPRRWREIVQVFVSAARGLEAAHAAGLIHRDFKPDNVLVDRGRRVRVVDFGLARRTADGTPLSEADAQLSPARLAVTVTRDNVVVGSPRYMAPEQHRGEVTDARSDQFAFCVALYEALYGVAPFAGETTAELREAVGAGRIALPSDRRGVPSWLRSAVLVGLRPDREARYPTMAATIDAILRDPPARVRRLLAAFVVTGALGAAAYAGWAVRRAPAQMCQRVDEGWKNLWDEPSRATVHQAFLAAGGPFAARSFTEVSAVLEARQAKMAAGATEACQATHVRHEQSLEVQDLRLRCLDRQRQEFQALVKELEHANAETVAGAVHAASALDDPSSCADLQALVGQTRLPSDPAVRARIAGLDRLLSYVKTWNRLRQPALVMLAATPGVAVAREIGFQPQLAELLVEEANARRELGDYAGAERAFIKGVDAALASKSDRLGITALSGEVVVAGDQERPEEAARWAELAQAMVQRIGGEKTALGASVLFARGVLALDRSRYKEAARLFQQEVALREALGGDELDLVPPLTDLAIAQDNLSAYAEARVNAQRALDILERMVGPDHPSMANVLATMASLEAAQSHYEDALRLGTQALHVTEVAFGPDSGEVVTYLIDLGQYLNELNRVDEALATERRAQAIATRAFAPDHPMMLKVRVALAELLTRRNELAASATETEALIASMDRKHQEGPALANAVSQLADVRMHQLRLPEAQVATERALGLVERLLGPEHPNANGLRQQMAEILLRQGHPEEALPLAQRALAAYVKLLGPDHLAVAYTARIVGRIEVALAAPGDALPRFEKALATLEANQRDPTVIAVAKLELAQALWDTGGDRARARKLATEGRDVLADHHPVEEKDLALDLDHANAWLASHRLR